MLLWSAQPQFRHDIAASRTLLNNAAVHILDGICDGGPPVMPNNTYGYGRVDILAAASPSPPQCPPGSQLITILDESFDNVTPPALPPGWTATNGINPDGILWQTSNSGVPTPPADTPPNAAWVNDPALSATSTSTYQAFMLRNPTSCG